MVAGGHAGRRHRAQAPRSAGRENRQLPLVSGRYPHRLRVGGRGRLVPLRHRRGRRRPDAVDGGAGRPRRRLVAEGATPSCSRCRRPATGVSGSGTRTASTSSGSPNRTTTSRCGLPTAKRIAFLSRRDGNPELYVMLADGSEQTRLTNTTEPEYQVSWSPDGRRVLFVSERDGNPEIYVTDVKGDNVSAADHEQRPGRRAGVVAERASDSLCLVPRRRRRHLRHGRRRRQPASAHEQRLRRHRPVLVGWPRSGP